MCHSQYRWYFELLDMGHKLIITSVLVFFPTNAMMPVGMCVSICYTFIILIKRPYVRRGDDRMHLFTQVCIAHCALSVTTIIFQSLTLTLMLFSSPYVIID
jgi:hypothetical protein